jgi:Trehalase
MQRTGCGTTSTCPSRCGVRPAWPWGVCRRRSRWPYLAKDPAHFRTTPGGYFHGMVAKAKAGELNLDCTLWAMRRAAEPKPHPNRYWDERGAPRDESFKEDVRTALQSRRPDAEVWRNLRAAAESGWDFSSRWLADGRTLNTIRTLDLLPPDLNGALVHLEQTPACPRHTDSSAISDVQRSTQSVRDSGSVDQCNPPPDVAQHGIGWEHNDRGLIPWHVGGPQ